MIDRLESKLAALRATRRCGLAPFVTAGDGGIDTTLAVLHALEQAGAACVELGLPFSDPIADGPVLQAAAQRALEAGATLERVVELIARFRQGGGELPIALMGYANPLVRRGWGQVTRTLVEAGADALLVADLPVEEGGAMQSAALEAGLCPIFFASPTSSDERIARSAHASRGFLYTILRTGVTGRASAIDAERSAFLARVRRLAGDLPIAAGFGVRDRHQVRAICAHAELVIVGSALVEALHAAGDGPDRRARAAREYLHELSQGIPA